MRPTALFVDDEPMNLSTFVRSFRKVFDVRTAPCASAALAELTRGAVDIVISDYAMPGMSGLELLEQVRQLYPNTARVIISGHSELPVLQTATGVVQAILPKPWDNDVVTSVVQRLTTRPEAGESHQAP